MSFPFSNTFCSETEYSGESSNLNSSKKVPLNKSRMVLRLPRTEDGIGESEDGVGEFTVWSIIIVQPSFPTVKSPRSET